MFGLGFQEILLILLVALLLFGAKKLPGMGKAIGQSFREFKKAFSVDPDKSEDTTDEQKGKQSSDE